MLEWEKLLSETRRKSKHEKKGEKSGTGGSRTEIERDYDRILFATPTRRLADKTQVFPHDPSDSVRTRLTHSHEVSNLARSIGMSLAFDHAEEVFGSQHDILQVKRKVPAMLAAIGLAHDLGNPPFGHQGEVAMREWFTKLSIEKRGKVPPDFKLFDGNPHTFRLLTRLQILNDNYGLNLTCGTLGALVKYPSMQSSKSKGGYKKFGIFESERMIIQDVWEETGLREGVRHPLTHIMEACDDIAYAVVDAEDTVKKGFASFNDLIDHLSNSNDAIVKRVVKGALEENSEFKKAKLSSSELNEISMQMFRVYAIYELIQACTKTFVSKIGKIMSCKIPEGFELLEASEAADLASLLKDFGQRYGFRNRQVLELELNGQNYIEATMNMLWSAIDKKNQEKKAFSKYASAMISENYKRAYESSAMSPLYKDCQLLSDSISGMTDQYLMDFHDKLRPLHNGYS